MKKTVQIYSLMLSIILGASSLSLQAGTGESPLQNTMVHHVFIWLEEPENEQVRKQFEHAMEELTTIPNIAFSQIGVPARTEARSVVDHSYTYSMVIVFHSKEDHDIYQEHPIHLKFVEENQHLWERVKVYDSVDY